jgi:hypothetical protein
MTLSEIKEKDMRIAQLEALFGASGDESEKKDLAILEMDLKIKELEKKLAAIEQGEEKEEGKNGDEGLIQQLLSQNQAILDSESSSLVPRHFKK